uniref:Uncharacterized protein n=1 Tax=Crocodylus porosus TaxID=8502 RepID=A0A7M4EZH8_CROPO
MDSACPLGCQGQGSGADHYELCYFTTSPGSCDACLDYGDMTHRPLLTNLDSPGPATYLPTNTSCRETSVPTYTFGRKTPSQEGGGCRSWQKSWFHSKNPFTRKVDFKSEINVSDASLPEYPSYTIGQRRKVNLVSNGECHYMLSSIFLKCNFADALNNPAPNKYNTAEAYFHMWPTSPSYSICSWSKGTRGPGAYNVEKGHIARLPKSPSVIIQGTRRPKKHATGPFATL